MVEPRYCQGLSVGDDSFGGNDGSIGQVVRDLYKGTQGGSTGFGGVVWRVNGGHTLAGFDETPYCVDLFSSVSIHHRVNKVNPPYLW